MIFPLHDANPTTHKAYVTFGIIGTTAACWLLLQGAGFGSMFTDSLCNYGLMPGALLGNTGEYSGVQLSAETVCLFADMNSLVALITTMFMHGGWMHIIGNLWFLYIFGDNLEDALGSVKFLIFYLVTGVVATMFHVFSDPGSLAPLVGASGAISGVMGAYILLYPKARINTLVFLGFFITTIQLPALVVIGAWFAMQLLLGIGSIGGQGGGVAYWAHIGGFLAGVILISLLRDRYNQRFRLFGKGLR